jgi:hypothetical protein
MATKVNLWKRPVIDYSSRDFESIRDDMLRTIPYFCEEWTDFNPSDFGIVMMELFAFMGDVIHYYIDRMAAESFLPTAITRRSVVNLLKLIDYQLRGYVASTVDLKFVLAQPLAGDFTIPAWTQLKTLCDRQGAQTGQLANNIFFETAAQLVVPIGETEGTVSAIQGKTAYDTTTGDPYIPIGTSNGLANQKFTIPDTPVINGTLRVFVDEGVGKEEWTIVDTTIENQSCDKVCMAAESDQFITSVQFGDNGHGKIPDPQAPIYASYRVGGGLVGNVGAGTITLLESPLTFAGSPVTLTITNDISATGGEDPESIESARLSGPRTLRALYRAVTPEDYQSLSEVYPGVAKAKAVVGQWESANHACACQVSLFLVPSGGGLPSTFLKQSLVNYLDGRKNECVCVEAFDPTYQPVDVKGNVITYSNFNVDDVRNTLLSTIDAYFNEVESPYTGFDKGAYLSDITAVIDGVDGVDHVDLTDLTRHPYPVFENWAGSDGGQGSAGAHDGAEFDENEWFIGSCSVAEQWTLQMTSPTAFTVSGTTSGFQGTGTLGVNFVSSNGCLAFLLTPGTLANQPGDVVRFKTSPKLSNVNVTAGEFFTKGTVALTFSIGGPGPRTRCV